MALAPNTKVRVKNDPSRIGHTTAARKNIGPMQYVQVDYGTTKNYHPESHLEVVLEHENPDVLFKKCAFGAPDTLRMAVILEKLQGQITNMFYSMNVSSADFLPYQFKPVLKFIESISGRILIADEVGLGKTIEAAYIWKELEARKDAKRLLVVCPAVLREKWKHDLHNLFGIRAQIWDARTLHNEISQAYLDPYSTFVGIVSIEAIRTKYDEDSDTPAKTFQDKITELLITQRDRQADFSLFDLVIIDEAHYLRNQNTANNKTATLIRDTAEHLVLLSATPVQTSSRNLYELLRLMAPEDYYDYQAYLGAIEENRPILDAIAAINKASTTFKDIQHHSQQLRRLVDESIRDRMEAVYRSGDPTPQERVDISWRLSEYSYLNEYMNRICKRDVKTC
jgi:SNF2 family DNA or RNA helicase